MEATRIGRWQAFMARHATPAVLHAMPAPTRDAYGGNAVAVPVDVPTSALVCKRSWWSFRDMPANKGREDGSTWVALLPAGTACGRGDSLTDSLGREWQILGSDLTAAGGCLVSASLREA